MTTIDILLVCGLFFALSGVLFFYDRRKIRQADKLTILIAPLILVFVSFSVVTRKIGGTIMSDIYGWPHFIASYQFKDVLDGTLIREWHLAIGSLGAYLIVDYLFYLSIVLSCFFLIRVWFRSNTKATIGLLLVLAIIAGGLFSSQVIKEKYIKQEISRANYCEAAADCSDAGSQCPFDCYAYVNRGEVGRIAGLISSFRSTCTYSCLACPTVACVAHRCKPVCDVSGDRFLNNDEAGTTTSASKAESTSEFNFSKTGIAIKESAEHNGENLYILYEEPGKPALRARLKFDEKSMCGDRKNQIICMALSVSDFGLSHGHAIEVVGIKTNDVVVVRQLFKIN